MSLRCCTRATSLCQIIYVPTCVQCNHSNIQDPFNKTLCSKFQGCASKSLHVDIYREVNQKIKLMIFLHIERHGPKTKPNPAYQSDHCIFPFVNMLEAPPPFSSPKSTLCLLHELSGLTICSYSSVFHMVSLLDSRAILKNKCTLVKKKPKPFFFWVG